MRDRMRLQLPLLLLLTATAFGSVCETPSQLTSTFPMFNELATARLPLSSADSASWSRLTPRRLKEAAVGEIQRLLRLVFPRRLHVHDAKGARLLLNSTVVQVDDLVVELLDSRFACADLLRQQLLLGAWRLRQANQTSSLMPRSSEDVVVTRRTAIGDCGLRLKETVRFVGVARDGCESREFGRLAAARLRAVSLRNVTVERVESSSFKDKVVVHVAELSARVGSLTDWQRLSLVGQNLSKSEFAACGFAHSPVASLANRCGACIRVRLSVLVRLRLRESAEFAGCRRVVVSGSNFSANVSVERIADSLTNSKATRLLFAPDGSREILGVSCDNRTLRLRLRLRVRLHSESVLANRLLLTSGLARNLNEFLAAKGVGLGSLRVGEVTVTDSGVFCADHNVWGRAQRRRCQQKQRSLVHTFDLALTPDSPLTRLLKVMPHQSRPLLQQMLASAFANSSIANAVAGVDTSVSVRRTSPQALQIVGVYSPATSRRLLPDVREFDREFLAGARNSFGLRGVANSTLRDVDCAAAPDSIDTTLLLTCSTLKTASLLVQSNDTLNQFLLTALAHKAAGGAGVRNVSAVELLEAVDCNATVCLFSARVSAPPAAVAAFDSASLGRFSASLKLLPNLTCWGGAQQPLVQPPAKFTFRPSVRHAAAGESTQLSLVLRLPSSSSRMLKLRRLRAENDGLLRFALQSLLENSFGLDAMAPAAVRDFVSDAGMARLLATARLPASKNVDSSAFADAFELVRSERRKTSRRSSSQLTGVLLYQTFSVADAGKATTEQLEPLLDKFSRMLRTIFNGAEGRPNATAHAFAAVPGADNSLEIRALARLTAVGELDEASLLKLLRSELAKSVWTNFMFPAAVSQAATFARVLARRRLMPRRFWCDVALSGRPPVNHPLLGVGQASLGNASASLDRLLATAGLTDARATVLRLSAGQLHAGVVVFADSPIDCGRLARRVAVASRLLNPVAIDIVDAFGVAPAAPATSRIQHRLVMLHQQSAPHLSDYACHLVAVGYAVGGGQIDVGGCEVRAVQHRGRVNPAAPEADLLLLEVTAKATRSLSLQHFLAFKNFLLTPNETVVDFADFVASMPESLRRVFLSKPKATSATPTPTTTATSTTTSYVSAKPTTTTPSSRPRLLTVKAELVLPTDSRRRQFLTGAAGHFVVSRALHRCLRLRAGLESDRVVVHELKLVGDRLEASAKLWVSADSAQRTMQRLLHSLDTSPIISDTFSSRKLRVAESSSVAEWPQRAPKSRTVDGDAFVSLEHLLILRLSSSSADSLRLRDTDFESRDLLLDFLLSQLVADAFNDDEENRLRDLPRLLQYRSDNSTATARVAYSLRSGVRLEEFQRRWRTVAELALGSKELLDIRVRPLRRPSSRGLLLRQTFKVESLVSKRSLLTLPEQFLQQRVTAEVHRVLRGAFDGRDNSPSFLDTGLTFAKVNNSLQVEALTRATSSPTFELDGEGRRLSYLTSRALESTGDLAFDAGAADVRVMDRRDSPDSRHWADFLLSASSRDSGSSVADSLASAKWLTPRVSRALPGMRLLRLSVLQTGRNAAGDSVIRALLTVGADAPLNFTRVLASLKSSTQFATVSLSSPFRSQSGNTQSKAGASWLLTRSLLLLGVGDVGDNARLTKSTVSFACHSLDSAFAAVHWSSLRIRECSASVQPAAVRQLPALRVQLRARVTAEMPTKDFDSTVNEALELGLRIQNFYFNGEHLVLLEGQGQSRPAPTAKMIVRPTNLSTPARTSTIATTTTTTTTPAPTSPTPPPALKAFVVRLEFPSSRFSAAMLKNPSWLTKKLIESLLNRITTNSTFSLQATQANQTVSSVTVSVKLATAATAQSLGRSLLRSIASSDSAVELFGTRATPHITPAPQPSRTRRSVALGRTRRSDGARKLPSQPLLMHTIVLNIKKLNDRDNYRYCERNTFLRNAFSAIVRDALKDLVTFNGNSSLRCRNSMVEIDWKYVPKFEYKKSLYNQLRSRVQQSVSKFNTDAAGRSVNESAKIAYQRIVYHRETVKAGKYVGYQLLLRLLLVRFSAPSTLMKLSNAELSNKNTDLNHHLKHLLDAAVGEAFEIKSGLPGIVEWQVENIKRNPNIEAHILLKVSQPSNLTRLTQETLAPRLKLALKSAVAKAEVQTFGLDYNESLVLLMTRTSLLRHPYWYIAHVTSPSLNLSSLRGEQLQELVSRLRRKCEFVIEQNNWYTDLRQPTLTVSMAKRIDNPYQHLRQQFVRLLINESISRPTVRFPMQRMRLIDTRPESQLRLQQTVRLATTDSSVLRLNRTLFCLFVAVSYSDGPCAIVRDSCDSFNVGSSARLVNFPLKPTVGGLALFSVDANCSADAAGAETRMANFAYEELNSAGLIVDSGSATPYKAVTVYHLITYDSNLILPHSHSYMKQGSPTHKQTMLTYSTVVATALRRLGLSGRLVSLRFFPSTAQACLTYSVHPSPGETAVELIRRLEPALNRQYSIYAHDLFMASHRSSAMSLNPFNVLPRKELALSASFAGSAPVAALCVLGVACLLLLVMVALLVARLSRIRRSRRQVASAGAAASTYRNFNEQQLNSDPINRQPCRTGDGLSQYRNSQYRSGTPY